jgi:hypothetical protein
MTTEGFEAVFLETHNWGRAARFLQGLGLGLEFSTGRNSSQLRNGDGSYLFIAEVPADREPQVRIALKRADADEFRAGPDVEVSPRSRTALSDAFRRGEAPRMGAERRATMVGPPACT